MIAGNQPWKPGDIIRLKSDPSRTFYVTFVNKFHTQAVDLTEKTPYPPTINILERNYKDWVKDLDITVKEKKGGFAEWTLAPAF